jgi:mannose-6-phosphate isomerase-like protein (cupin superfamily)
MLEPWLRKAGHEGNCNAGFIWSHLDTAAGSESQKFEVWTVSQLKDVEKQLANDSNDRFPTVQLGEYSNHPPLMQQRRSDGWAEVHELQNDILVVKSGEGTSVLGATVVNPVTVRPHEIRGTAISGGEEERLRAGDVVHISAGTPHQSNEG